MKIDIDSLLIQFKSALLEIDDTASGTAYDWYQTIKNRASLHTKILDFAFNDDEEKMLWMISAHFDEYKHRMVNESNKEKEIFIKMRVISFGAIYSSLLHLKRQISEISNIPAYNSAYDTDLDYEIFHAKASLYSAAKFAVELADVKISDLEKWCPDYIHDKKLIKGDDQLDIVARILGVEQKGSLWNDENETKCLLIMKTIVYHEFPYGMRAEMCRDLEHQTGIKYNSLSAKVGNFLSLAGIRKPSNASNNSKRIYEKYKDYSHTQLAKALAEDYDGAIPDLEKSIELDPNDAEAYFNRGDSRYLLEDYSEAIADYNKAIEIDPNNVEAEVYFNRGDSKYHLEDYDGAIADFSIAIDLNPIYYEAYSKRGELRQMYNDFTEALADYTIAIEKGDEDPHRMALFNAMPEIEAISHQEERAKLYLNRGIVRNQLKNPKGALADANKSIELDGFAFVCEFRSINNIIVYFTLDAYCLRGMAKDDLGDFNGAIADYTKSIEIDSGPDNFMAHVQRAYTRRNLKDYNGAIADYDKMLEINPVFAEAFKALLKLDDNDADSGNAKEVEQGDTIRAEAKEGKNTRVDAQKAPELGEGKAKNKGNLFISLLVAFLTLIIVGIATEGSDEPFVMIMPAVASYLVFRWIRE